MTKEKKSQKDEGRQNDFIARSSLLLGMLHWLRGLDGEYKSSCVRRNLSLIASFFKVNGR